MDRTAWLNAFEARFNKLSGNVNPGFVAGMAVELRPGLCDLDPADVALASWAEWPEQEL